MEPKGVKFAIVCAWIIIFVCMIAFLLTVVYDKYYERYRILLTLPEYEQKVKICNNKNLIHNKYIYEVEKMQEIASNKFLEEVTGEDVEKIESYFDNFQTLLNGDNVSLEIPQIEEGDRFYIYCFYGEKYKGYSVGPLSFYDVYYFDTDSGTMHFIHSDYYGIF